MFDSMEVKLPSSKTVRNKMSLSPASQGVNIGNGKRMADETIDNMRFPLPSQKFKHKVVHVATPLDWEGSTFAERRAKMNQDMLMV
jgi:hypothetical protein